MGDRRRAFLVALCFVVIIVVAYQLSSSRSSQQVPIFTIQGNTTIGKDRDLLQDIQIERQDRLQEYCRRNNFPSDEIPYNMLASDEKRALYCYVPKVACTGWKRVIAGFETGRVYPKNVHRLFKFTQFAKYNASRQAEVKREYFTFIIVRHPFERLLSAFRNKFSQAYKDNFRRNFGARILRAYRQGLSQQQYQSGANVTFEEFCRYVVDLHRKTPDTVDSHVFGTNVNEHWDTVQNLCRPCSLRLDYIAKMETIGEDNAAILRALDAQKPMYEELLTSSKSAYEPIGNIMADHFASLSPALISNLYEVFRDDFEMFGYDVSEFYSDI